jgi:hypothetical protein
MAKGSGRNKADDYPVQVVTKRGIVELHMSPAAMHDFLTHQLHLPPDQVIRVTREQIEQNPRRETFWKLVGYIALSGGGA